MTFLFQLERAKKTFFADVEAVPRHFAETSFTDCASQPNLTTLKMLLRGSRLYAIVNATI